MPQIIYRRVAGLGARLDVSGPDGRPASIQLPAVDHLVLHVDSPIKGIGASFTHANTLTKTFGLRESALMGADGSLESHPGPAVKAYFAIPTEHIEFGNIATEQAIAARVNGVESWLHFSETKESGRVLNGSIGSDCRIEMPNDETKLFRVVDAATPPETLKQKGWKLHYSEPDPHSTQSMERKIHKLSPCVEDERLDVHLAEVLGFERRDLFVEGPEIAPNAPGHERGVIPAPGFDDNAVAPPAPRRHFPWSAKLENPKEPIVWDGRTVQRRMIDKRLCDIQLPATDHLIVYFVEPLNDGTLQQDYPNTLAKTVGLGMESFRWRDESLGATQIPVLKTAFAIPVEKIKLSDFDKTGAYVSIAGSGTQKLIYPDEVKPGGDPRVTIPAVSRIVGAASISDILQIANLASPRSKLVEQGWSMDQVAEELKRTESISEAAPKRRRTQSELVGLSQLDRSLTSVQPTRSVGKSLRVAKLLADLDAMEPDPAELER